jgi:hypothetical protein
MKLLVDSKSTLDLAKQQIAYGKNKRIETEIAFLKGSSKQGEIGLATLQNRSAYCRCVDKSFED